MVLPTEPAAASDLETSEAGRTRKLLLDEMLAERARPPLPPAPVLTVEPVPVDAAPIAGRRGVRKRLEEVEALARRNLRAAEEARRVAFQERELLEEEASARTKAERTAAALRQEIERLRATEEQRAAQARFTATHDARAELATEMERVHGEHARVVEELDRMRGTLFDHDSLLDEYSRRLREEQEAQALARGEQTRAEEAQHVAERNLEIATETARRRAEEDLARFTQVERAWRDACTERDRVTAELQAITMGDGELVRLRSELEAAHEDTTRLLADLDVQAARADTAESELAEAREARAHADAVAAEASEARDLAGIALETTRSELAEKAEALDAHRSSTQARIAELTAQLATATRTAESATERSADLETRLDAAISAHELAVGREAAANEQLTRAQSDCEQLRAQAASIGDELAATQAELERSKTDLDRAREEARQAALAVKAAAAIVTAQPSPVIEETATSGTAATPIEVPPVAFEPPSSSFDVARASAFGHELSEIADAPSIASETEPEPETEAEAEARPTFRIAEDPGVVRVRAGGPIVELETALARGIEPIERVESVDRTEADNASSNSHTDGDVDDADGGEPKKPARSPETQAWRRTAMAELTALAADDDLTPNRRR
jgi:chromosome segregation ATPase